MNIFRVIPLFLRSAAPGDILVATLGNLSELRPPQVLQSVDLKLPPLTNLSDLDVSGHARIYFHEGAVVDIDLPALTDTETLYPPTVSAAPAPGFIRLPAITDADTFASPTALTVSVAPADGFIRLPALTDSDTLVAPTVEELGPGASDSYDPMVAGEPVGGGIV